MTSSPIGIFCGSGALPFAVADSLTARGVGVFLLAFKGFADTEGVKRYPHQWVTLGQYGLSLKRLRTEGCRRITFIGGLVRPSLSEIWPDWGGLRALPRVVKAFRGGDDHLLKGLISIFEADGFEVVGVHTLAPEILMPVGELAHCKPDGDIHRDIERGLDVLRAISPFDVGQAVVVIEGHVVAIEDIGGTDVLLARVTQLREQRRIRAPVKRGVLVKAPKVGQDMRFDLPSLGPKTIEGVAAAQLAGIAVVAGHTVVAEPARLIELADQHRLFVTGLAPTEPSP